MSTRIPPLKFEGYPVDNRELNAGIWRGFKKLMRRVTTRDLGSFEPDGVLDFGEDEEWMTGDYDAFDHMAAFKAQREIIEKFDALMMDPDLAARGGVIVAFGLMDSILANRATSDDITDAQLSMIRIEFPEFYEALERLKTTLVARSALDGMTLVIEPAPVGSLALLNADHQHLARPNVPRSGAER